MTAKDCVAIVAVDPGIQTGVAAWHTFDDLVPFATATFRSRLGAKERGHWKLAAKSVAFQFRDWMSQFSMISEAKAYIEEPAFLDNYMGHTVARRGDLGKLFMITGWEFGILNQLGYDAHLVPVINWKGQLSKLMVHYRIQPVLGRPGKKIMAWNHVWDAIGIGLAVRGFLNVV